MVVQEGQVPRLSWNENPQFTGGPWLPRVYLSWPPSTLPSCTSLELVSKASVQHTTSSDTMSKKPSTVAGTAKKVKAAVGRRVESGDDAGTARSRDPSRRATAAALGTAGQSGLKSPITETTRARRQLGRQTTSVPDKKVRTAAKPAQVSKVPKALVKERQAKAEAYVAADQKREATAAQVYEQSVAGAKALFATPEALDVFRWQTEAVRRLVAALEDADASDRCEHPILVGDTWSAYTETLAGEVDTILFPADEDQEAKDRASRAARWKEHRDSMVKRILQGKYQGLHDEELGL